MKTQAPLDWLNFFLADVQAGVGPFLAIFLLSSQRWGAGEIGVVMMIAGVATVAARTPFGALIDWTRWKRGLVVDAAVAVAAGAVAMSLFPNFWLVAAGQTLIGSADAVFLAAIGAISLGIVGPQLFTRGVGRNEAFNHAGNAFTAITAGLAGWLVAPRAVLWLVAALGATSILAVLAINFRSIDHDFARGSDKRHDGQPSGLRVILECKPLLIFTASITLFHFANAAMLPLLGEKLAQSNHGAETLFMAACIITAQLVMVPMPVLVGHEADSWGLKPIFLVGFAVLPVRGFLYILTQDTDAGPIRAGLDPIAGRGWCRDFRRSVLYRPRGSDDLTKGTGRYNLAQGAASARWGLGAALSNSVAGYMVDMAGYSAAFLLLAASASIAFLLFLFAMPETRSEVGTTLPPALEAARNAPAPAD